MPAPKENETRQEYMSRCVPIRRREHPDEKNEQSIAVCFSMWRESKKKKAKSETKKEKE